MTDDHPDRRVVTTRRLRAWLWGWFRVTGGAAGAAAAGGTGRTRSARAARTPAALTPKERTRAAVRADGAPGTPGAGSCRPAVQSVPVGSSRFLQWLVPS